MIEIRLSIAPETLKTLDKLTDALIKFSGKNKAVQTIEPPQTENEAKSQDCNSLRETITTLLRQNLKTKSNDMRALLNKYGAKKASALTDEQLVPFLEELKELIAA